MATAFAFQEFHRRFQNATRQGVSQRKSGIAKHTNSFGMPLYLLAGLTSALEN
jgi:hypothetical protein